MSDRAPRSPSARPAAARVAAGDRCEVDGPFFRPYLLTAGRTRSIGEDLPIEALIVTRLEPVANAMSPEHAVILDICRTPTSIAELAAQLSVPIGVARVLVCDLAATGWAEVCDTGATDPDTVQRIIDGVRTS